MPLYSYTFRLVCHRTRILVYSCARKRVYSYTRIRLTRIVVYEYTRTPVHSYAHIRVCTGIHIRVYRDTRIRVCSYTCLFLRPHTRALSRAYALIRARHCEFAPAYSRAHAIFTLLYACPRALLHSHTWMLLRTYVLARGYSHTLMR